MRFKWLWFLIPMSFTLLRLKQLGVFGQPLTGIDGSDFYWYASLIKLFQIHPAGIPNPIPEFSFPIGTPRHQISEYFGEPVMGLFLRIVSWFTTDAIRGMWLAIVLTTTLNTLGVWAILWRRVRPKTPAAALTVTVGWAILIWSPWIWARSMYHWHLSWVFILLPVVLLWWDFFVHDKKPRLLTVGVLHFLLLGQSIYYGFFVILLVAFWCLLSLPRFFKDRSRAKAALTLIAVAGAGYLADAVWVVQSEGGIAAVRQEAKRISRTELELHMYSSRMRNLLRGGPESAWNDWAQKLGKQRPDQNANDGEHFPSPLPKLALLAALFFWVRPAQARAHRFFLVGAFGLLVASLQETPWIKHFVLYPLFPFIRSYARVTLPVLCLIAVWISEIGSARESERTSTAPALRLAAGFLLLLLIRADYGPLQPAPWMRPLASPSQRTPCDEAITTVQKQGLPILLQQTQLPQSQQSGKPMEVCHVREQDLLSWTGLPLLSQPWTTLGQTLPPHTPLCDFWKKKLAAATGVAADHAVLWWFDGTPAQYEASARCFQPAAVTRLHEVAKGSETSLILSRVEVSKAP